MRIAQIAPLYESVPPARYGGTERMVSYLTEALVGEGHDVTLFASGDSMTTATLVPTTRRSLRSDPDCRDPFPHHVLQLEQVARQTAMFDVLHFHTGVMHYPMARRLASAHLTTLHGRLDVPDLGPLFDEFRDLPLVSISNAQRAPFPDLHWRRTIHHGLPEHLFRPGPGRGDYLLFLGRLSPEKRPDRAIAIAKRSGRPLLIAAKVGHADQTYFDSEIRPLIDGRHIQFLGEVNDTEKQALLGDACALIFPIDWPEPFGLVVIESLACGTPVIAWPHGSVPELVSGGETGFLVSSVQEAVQAVARIGEISRAVCRRVFEERFLDTRMARDYLATYATLGGHTEAAA